MIKSDKAKKATFAMLYHPQCKYSKLAKDEFIALAHKLPEDLKDKIQLAAINDSQAANHEDPREANTRVGPPLEEVGVFLGYPTFRMYKEGVITDMQHEPKYDEFVKFLHHNLA